MARLHIASVQPEMVRVKFGRANGQEKVLVEIPATPLTAVGLELLCRQSYWYTGPAGTAMGPIDMRSGAAETHLRQDLIGFHVYLGIWIDKQGGGLTIFQITAGVGQTCVKS